MQNACPNSHRGTGRGALRARVLIWIKERTASANSTIPSLTPASTKMGFAPNMSDHKRLSTSRPPRPKHCPICGIAMLASRAATGSRDIDRFECLSCDLVINYSGSTNPRPATPDE